MLGTSRRIATRCSRCSLSGDDELDRLLIPQPFLEVLAGAVAAFAEELGQAGELRSDHRRQRVSTLVRRAGPRGAGLGEGRFDRHGAALSRHEPGDCHHRVALTLDLADFGSLVAFATQAVGADVDVEGAADDDNRRRLGRRGGEREDAGEQRGSSSDGHRDSWQDNRVEPRIDCPGLLLRRSSKSRRPGDGGRRRMGIVPILCPNKAAGAASKVLDRVRWDVEYPPRFPAIRTRSFSHIWMSCPNCSGGTVRRDQQPVTKLHAAAANLFRLTNW